jgi:hypothetical protein
MNCYRVTFKDGSCLLVNAKYQADAMAKAKAKQENKDTKVIRIENLSEDQDSK